MKIGILKSDDVYPVLAQEYGEYPDMFINLLSKVDPNLHFVIYAVQHGEYPAHIDDVDAYLITGSKASVYDDAGWIHQLIDFVRKLHEAQKKLVGICFGHQLVAHALGGRTAKSEKGWGIGRHSYQLTEQAAEFAPPGEEFSILASHQDQVVEPAEGAEILASSDFCPVAMTRVGDHILTFQGHPEFNPDYAHGLMDVRRDLYNDTLYNQAVDSLTLPLDQLQVAQWIVEFLRR